MAGEPAAPFNPQRTTQLPQNDERPLRRRVCELTRPQRNQSRQVALSEIAAGVGLGHHAENASRAGRHLPRVLRRFKNAL